MAVYFLCGKRRRDEIEGSEDKREDMWVCFESLKRSEKHEWGRREEREILLHVVGDASRLHS